MSILEILAAQQAAYELGHRQPKEGEIERQLNNVIDRGLKLYLGYLAADQFGLIGDSQDDSSDLGTGLQAGILKQVGLIPSVMMPKKLEALASLRRLFS